MSELPVPLPEPDPADVVRELEREEKAITKDLVDAERRRPTIREKLRIELDEHADELVAHAIESALKAEKGDAVKAVERLMAASELKETLPTGTITLADVESMSFSQLRVVVRAMEELE